MFHSPFDAEFNALSEKKYLGESGGPTKYYIRISGGYAQKNYYRK